MSVVASYPLASALDCPSLQMALAVTLAQANVLVLTTPTCSVALSPSSGTYSATMNTAVNSADDAAAVQTQLLSPSGMKDFVDVSGLPCLSTISIMQVRPTSATRAACSKTYPALCCKPPPPPFSPSSAASPPPPPCECPTMSSCDIGEFVASFDARTATLSQLLQLQVSVSLELLQRLAVASPGNSTDAAPSIPTRKL